MNNTTAKRVAALGFFDGVHIGHAQLLRQVQNVSETTGLTPCVITFDTLPQNIVGVDYIPLITSPEDKVGLINRLFNIDDIITLPFNSLTAVTPWDEFIDRLIIEHDVRHFIVGSNFRFGKGAEGNSKLLTKKCEESSLSCNIIDNVLFDDIVCSSTYIRELLLTGCIERANAFLGHKHVFTNVVRSGQRLGRTLDAPTINMVFENGVLVPAYGVYATKVYIEDNKPYNGVTNIGIRPTVDDRGLVTAETFIFDFNETLYDSKVRLEFHNYLRSEQKFKNINELKEQIKKDCKTALEYFV